MYRFRSVVVVAITLLLLLAAGCAPQAAAPTAAPAASTAVAPSSTQTAPSPTTGPLATASQTPAPTALPSATEAPPTALPSATQAPPTSTVSAAATQDNAAPPVVVAMKDYAFVPKDITVAPGTTVTWRNDDSAPHTATADDKLFGSGDMSQGATFSYTFTKAGVYPYYCIWHGAAGGQGMAGTVTVK